MQANGESHRVKSTRDAKVLFVTPGKLGDSLISLVIPANLARASFKVTVRGDCAHDLAKWLPQFQTGPRLTAGDYPGTLDRYDFCLIDSQAPGLQSDGVDLRPALAHRAVFFSLAHHEKSLDGCFDRDTLPADKRDLLQERVPKQGLLRDKTKPGLTMVEHAVDFCRRELSLGEAQADIGLAVPEDVSAQGQKERIIISPTSGKARKNWLAGRFIMLAQQLQETGQECVFTVAPSEATEWTERLGGRFPLAQTPNAAALAALLTSARALVCNDSGAGHLASALGVPVVCVIPRRDSDYAWRPGWGAVALVSPVLPVRGLSRLWPYFVSVKQVRHSLESFLKTATETS
ncbi:MAG: hypothetical protein CL389_10105 [Acidiferrobacteraceae bacterium]|jgi:hypothetical protein|nr:hypothetical protein [Acidiferrobacteraceae bacterium]MDP6550995.1 glycosyltransferase family 9 protein [Arenicellales bacterium]MDP6919387.1 glycosyltransferase family 9 protein [Arenicellales bacterium]